MTHRKKPWVVRFWESDSSLSFLLLFLTLGVFVAYPAAEVESRRWVLDVSFTLVLISGVWAVARRRMIVWVVALIAVTTLLTRWMHHVIGAQPLQIADAVLSMLALSILAAVVVTQVFREGRITIHRVQGAIVVYLLIGFVWTSAYVLLDIVLPAAFNFGATGRGPSVPRLMYFSIVTLTTTGYGDITPLHPIARSLSMIEALVGQLFPVVMIGRLVAMELEHSKRFKPGD
ncbi:MAG: potassium channel family protein [Acidobacteriota bacterium]